MKQIEAKIIADSINEQGDRIITYILTFPRFILAELNTHRMFTRNSSSSRAIPFDKIVKMVEEDPFIPIAWQKDHKGMQGTEYFSGWRAKVLKLAWISASKAAIWSAKKLHGLGLTKQLCNRLLEPFMWHTCLLTTTDLENFFEQRCPQYVINWYPPNHPEAVEPTQGIFKSKKDALSRTGGECRGWTEEMWRDVNVAQAEIHMQALAEAMWDAYNESKPKLLRPLEWHLPFGDNIDELYIRTNWAKFTYADNMAIEETISFIKRKIATARCARISYLTFDKILDHEKDIELHNRLLQDRHMSPFEHCACAMTATEYNTFVKGKLSMNEFLVEVKKEHAGWCNNFKGFIPYRYMVENNYV